MDDMVKLIECSASVVRENKLKRLVNLDQKVSGQVTGFVTACTEMLHRRCKGQAEVIHKSAIMWNVETPYLRRKFSAGETARHTDEGAGVKMQEKANAVL